MKTKDHIPDSTLLQHLIALGKTGAGKSSVLRLLVERLLDLDKPVCVLDPKGDWWGLKSSADGKQAGYSVVIFGGDHADVPINSQSGAAIAELFATGNRPCIVDLGGWTVGDRTRFFIDFAQTLFRLSRSPHWLVIDEVHNFCPQGKVLDPEAGKMLHWANRLITEGRGKGLQILSASQRPQKVHKDWVTSCETLIAMRVIHPLDRKAIKEWIDGCPDADLGNEVLSTLASMKRGSGWVWSPEIDFGPERIAFPKFSTYDSFAAPTGVVSGKLKGWAEVDLQEITQKLAGAVEEARTNDPKLLKSRIAELERNLSQRPNAIHDPEALVAAEARGKALEAREWETGIHATLQHGERLVARMEEDAGSLKTVMEVLSGFAENRKGAALHKTSHKLHRPPPPTNKASLPADKPHPELPKPINGYELSSPQKQLLKALAWWRHMGHESPSRVQAAVVCGWRITSSHIKNVASSLSTAGMITYRGPGNLALTDTGMAAAPEPDVGQTLIDSVRGILTSPQTQVFDVLLRGGEMTREQITDVLGWSRESSHIKNVVSSLSSLELVEYPTRGSVQLTNWVR